MKCTIRRAGAGCPTSSPDSAGLSSAPRGCSWASQGFEPRALLSASIMHIQLVNGTHNGPLQRLLTNCAVPSSIPLP